jgi:D-proline reductase (dithiol) PrdB
VGEVSEFPVGYWLFLAGYPWRRVDPVPRAPLRQPLTATLVALVSTAGFVLPDQPSFDQDKRGGDTSFRVIPGDATVAALIDRHRSELFDHAGIRRDQNLAFPLDRLRELAAKGRIGSVAPRHLSFMGSITAPGRLVRDTAPAVARLLVQDGVQAALLVPV